MKLIDLVYPKYKTVSVVGTAKNAGKTAAMNEIIAQAESLGITLGLISTGRDGERRDILTNTEKPPVYAIKDTIITTVEDAISGTPEAEMAGIEILDVTDYKTPMGKVVLGRVIEAGYVEISGPGSSSTIKQTCDRMQRAGAELILIDGSLDRRASAAPCVSECTLIASGASLSRSMETVLLKTRHIVNLYTIPKADDSILKAAAKAIRNGETIIIDEDGISRRVDSKTSLLSGGTIVQSLSADSRYAVLQGSATFDTLRDIVLNKKEGLQIIVKDATRIFLDENELFMLRRMGMDLRVINSINVIAVTVNPYSPEGYYFNPEDFLRKMREAVPEIPVFDVMQEGC